MPKTSHKDFGCVLNMIESIQKILDYSGNFENADDFYNDNKSFDATMMNFVIIGEMVEKLSSGFIEETENTISWSRIKSFRNIVAHNYFGIDAEEVWQIIKNHLSEFKNSLEKTIE